MTILKRNGMVFLLILFFQAACAANEPYMPTPNPPDIPPELLLFQPEDIPGWSGPYSWGTPWRSPLIENDPFESVLAARMYSGEPIRGRYGKIEDHRGVIQDVVIYNSEEDARFVFEEFEKTSLTLIGYGELPRGIQFQPKLNNLVVGCWDAYDPVWGEFFNCNIMMQNDRYIIHGSMFVDGKTATLKDWGIFINAIQDKLAAQSFNGASPP